MAFLVGAMLHIPGTDVIQILSPVLLSIVRAWAIWYPMDIRV